MLSFQVHLGAPRRADEADSTMEDEMVHPGFRVFAFHLSAGLKRRL